MSPLRLLCLFSSAALRDASLFAGHEGTWATEIDQGPCQFVGLVVDEDVSTLASSGLFAAATLVCRERDLTPALAAVLRPAAAGFTRAAVPLEIVPAEGPVGTLAWLGAHAPELARLCRVDGEVRTGSPSWWRDRARQHLALAAGPREAEPEDLADELRAFVSRRGW